MRKKPSKSVEREKFNRKTNNKKIEDANLQERGVEGIAERVKVQLSDQWDNKMVPEQIDIAFVRLMQDIHETHNLFKLKESRMEINKEYMVFESKAEMFIPESERVRHIQRYEHSMGIDC